MGIVNLKLTDKLAIFQLYELKLNNILLYLMYLQSELFQEFIH